MTLLQKRKLRKYLAKTLISEKRIKLYLLNLHWIKIKKQKERRRRRTLIKLYKLSRLRMIKSMLKSVIISMYALKLYLNALSPIYGFLTQFLPCFSQHACQVLSAPYLLFVDPLFQYWPDSKIHGIQVWNVQGPINSTKWHHQENYPQRSGAVLGMGMGQ